MITEWLGLITAPEFIHLEKMDSQTLSACWKSHSQAVQVNAGF